MSDKDCELCKYLIERDDKLVCTQKHWDVDLHCFKGRDVK